MSQRAKQEYLNAIVERYKKANYLEKKPILDEFCKVCGYNRKYAIRKLSKKLKPPSTPVKRGRTPIYDARVIKVLAQIWEEMGRICSKKMKAIIPTWLNYLPVLECSTREKLLIMSASTIDRILAPTRRATGHRGISTTRATAFAKKHIPLKTEFDNESRPGFMHADTVAHCGDSLFGTYALSLTMTDIATTWTEERAVWSKGSSFVFEQIQDIEKNLPFKILGYHADNGGEVLNKRIFNYFQTSREEKDKIQITRSRPYKKNDQCYVEQKNFTHVRKIFGYERIDHRALVTEMNRIYKRYWNPLQNFFIPSAKCIKKTRIASKIVKTYDTLKTPYQRVLESELVSEEEKLKLITIYESLNPFELSKALKFSLCRFERELQRLNRIKQIESNPRSISGMRQ